MLCSVFVMLKVIGKSSSVYFFFNAGSLNLSGRFLRPEKYRVEKLFIVCKILKKKRRVRTENLFVFFTSEMYSSSGLERFNGASQM